ncbi:hypothetical protein WA158_007799 [Blastocystis sp. Blastoise]
MEPPAVAKSSSKDVFCKTVIFLIMTVVTFIASCIVDIFFYNKLPETCAVHWNAQNEVNRYGSKSELLVAGLLCPSIITVIFVFINLLITFMNVPMTSMPYWKKPENFKRLKPFMLNMLYLMAILCNLCYPYLMYPTWKYNLVCKINPENPVPCDYEMNIVIPLIVFLIAMFAPMIALIVYCVVIPKRYPSDTPLEKDPNWICGIIYANNQDSRLWVPKRLGIGWTLNCGSTVGIAIIIIFLILVCILCAVPFFFI